MKATGTRPHAPRAHRQRGTYAIEFTLVFLVFFGLIYSIICYAMVFTFRFGLQNAAEDGARAALRHQVNIEARRTTAERIATVQTQGWLPVTPEVTAAVVYQSGSRCGTTLDERCRIVVTVTANGLSQVLPPFPDFAMPNRLTGQASVLLDGRAL